MATLRVRGLSVEVQGRRVLEGVNLDVESGEVVYLLGPNGAGKSTLIHAVIGWEGYRVVSGSISLDGVELTGRPPEERARLGVAAGLQNPPALEGVRVGVLLRMLVERYWRVSSIEALRIVSRLVSMVGLPASILEREYNVGFSGGERKKLEVAKVIAMRPRVALLDEPDSGVDVDSLRGIGEAIDYLRREIGAGVLVVTHLARLCRYTPPSRAYVMLSGRVVREGGPELVKMIEERGYAAIGGGAG